MSDETVESTANRTWSFHDPATGIFDGRTFSGDADGLALQLAYFGPAVAAYEGVVDHARRRLDMATGAIVPYVPQAPAADQWQTWEWDAASESWVSQPTQAAVLRAAKEAFQAFAQAQLDQLSQAWGYDGIVSAASYVASGNAQFRAEAQALVSYRDAVWTAGYALETAVAAGSQRLPASTADFEAMLPAPPARPTTS